MNTEQCNVFKNVFRQNCPLLASNTMMIRKKIEQFDRQIDAMLNCSSSQEKLDLIELFMEHRNSLAHFIGDEERLHSVFPPIEVVVGIQV